MHAILTSIGTDGDIYPYLALGRALRARGHRVTLVTHENFGPAAAEAGLAFQSLASHQESEELLADPEFWHPLKGAWVGAKWGARFLRRQYDLLAQLAADRDSVLVASPAIVAARTLHDRTAVPIATVILQPWMIASSIEPPVMPARLTLPRRAPRLAAMMYWRLIDGAVDLLIGRPLNQMRSSLGLRPVRRLFRWWLSPQRVIGMFPEWYGPPQPDWPEQIRLVGFPVHDVRPSAALAPELADFCCDSQKPIAFTFGTGMRNGRLLFQAAVEASRILKRPAVLVTPHPGQLPAPVPEHVRHVAFAPFRELFPGCAAVVHHGGIGTIATAMASGAPQLVLPIAYDQFDNARRLARIGVGSWLGPRTRSPRQIADAVVRLMGSEVRAQCAQLAAQIAGDGQPLQLAAQCVEELARSSSTIPRTFGASGPSPRAACRAERRRGSRA